MKYWVGVTDDEWFHFLAAKKADEVNFWRPGAQAVWHPIPPGAPFLFKLHSPHNFIVGGGYFVKHTVLPLSLAWLAYGVNNGMESFVQLKDAIARYRRDKKEDVSRDPTVGCTLLAEPFYWEKSQWIPSPPEWPMNVVQGKTLDSEDHAVGQSLWEKVKVRLAGNQIRSSAASTGPESTEDQARFGTPRTVMPRLGQGAFRVMVTEAYQRRCAATGEKTLPVLEAAHIKPYSEGGIHQVANGLLLRSDLHILYDRGYIGVDQDLKLKVSPKIREEFSNGRDYYVHQGQKLVVIPSEGRDQPSREYLEWHLKERFLA
jgi:putative restriction endonuclease